MADVTILKIGGKQYDLPIFDFKIHIENLDGEGTGRMQAPGWPMFRDPQGTIINVDATIGAPTNRAGGDFLSLYNDMKSFGKTDFKSVTFMTPSGVITQEMYGTVGEIVAKRFVRDDETYWAAMAVKFIAKEAYT